MRLPRTDGLLIAGAALLLTVAYPPFQLVAPAFVCLVPAALLILRGCEDASPWRRHLHQGFWYGTMTHGVLLYWFAGALWQYGRGAVVLYVVAAIMFGGAYAVTFASVGLIVRGSRGSVVLALPAGVVFLEWLAAQVGPIGFPWHQLALTVTATPLLVQTADLVGAGGTAFILAAINSLVALTWWSRSDRGQAAKHLEVAGALLLFMVVYGAHRLSTLQVLPGPTVGVVQPNVTIDEKWVPGREEAVVGRTMRLTERALQESGARLVAWPETALPDVVQHHPSWTARITQLAALSRSTVLSGGVDAVISGSGDPLRYNAAFAFPGGGELYTRPVYRKRQLIPMVERELRATPDLTRTGFGGFVPGRAASVVESSIGPYGVLLCYELTFADMARRARRAGAELIVTLSNDAWFGRTAAPHQHFAHAALRAVENRVSVVRAANTGISGLVDPLGRVTVRTEPFVETWAVGSIWTAATTPWAVYLGAWTGPAALGLLLSMAGAALLSIRRRAPRGLRPEPSSSVPSE